MNVRDVMTTDPACCTEETGLQDVAQMMVDCDCGAIPVVQDSDSMTLVGIVTDRDITVRSVAKGMNPLEMSAGDVTSAPVVIARPDESLQELARTMEENQVRRVPVVDQNEAIVGIVAQADLALEGGDQVTAEVVEEVSRPTASSSDVHSRSSHRV